MNKDPINPSYYQLKCCDSYEYQLEVCERVPGDEAVGVYNILKYTTRYSQKNGSQDLKKAKWYLDKLIQLVEQKESKGRKKELQNVILSK